MDADTFRPGQAAKYFATILRSSSQQADVESFCRIVERTQEGQNVFPGLGRYARKLLVTGSNPIVRLQEAILNTYKDESKGVVPDGLKLKFLSPSQVKRIDDMLARLGEYGELHLIIQRGELRFINKVESYKAWTTEDEIEP